MMVQFKHAKSVYIFDIKNKREKNEEGMGGVPPPRYLSNIVSIC